MNFDPNTPIYLQIMDEFKRLIVAGTYQGGDKVKAVRELAVEYGVNPNTVQRALSELERDGLVRSERTNGRYICENKELIEVMRSKIAEEKTDLFIRELQEYGYEDEEITSCVTRRLQDGKLN